MALLIQQLYKGYNFLFEELADPRVKSFLFMESPFPTLAILCVYHLFVFKIGPHLMKNRPAFNLERILVVYNIFQILACLYLIIMQIKYTLFSYSIFCEPVDYSNSDIPVLITRHVWFYYILKLIDLLDTVFFVLRKKNNQITFLHLYHHTGMCLLTWIGTKYIAGGHTILVGFLNNIVHVIMYSYYLLSAWDKEYKKNLWWKKYLTQIQIVQFFLIGIYYIQLPFQPTCKYPSWTTWYFVPQNIFMIVLFTNFYLNAYVRPKKTLKAKKQTVPVTNGIVTDKQKAQ